MNVPNKSYGKDNKCCNRRGRGKLDKNNSSSKGNISR